MISFKALKFCSHSLLEIEIIIIAWKRGFKFFKTPFQPKSILKIEILTILDINY